MGKEEGGQRGQQGMCPPGEDVEGQRGDNSSWVMAQPLLACQWWEGGQEFLLGWWKVPMENLRFGQASARL